MFDFAVDRALHHRGAIVVLYVAFPSRLYHKALAPLQVLLKALLPKILDCIVVRVSQKVIDVTLDRMIF